MTGEDVPAFEVVVIADDEPPAPDAPRLDRRRRRWPIAVLVVVVALAAAVLARDEEPAETVAPDGGAAPPPALGDVALPPVLDQPGALEFAVRAVYVPPGPPGGPALGDVTLHAPLGSAAPWPETVTSLVQLHGAGDDRVLFGRVVDIGGPTAVVRAAGTTRAVHWWADGRELRIASATATDDDLVALATMAVDASWDGDGALPGHEVVHVGPPSDYFPTLQFAPLSEPGAARVAYVHPGDRDFVIGASPGGAGRWRATREFARTVRPVVIDGHDAIVATFDGPDFPTEVSWLEGDTVVAIETRGSVDELLAHIEGHLVPADAATFAALAQRYPSDRSTAFLDPVEVGDTTPSLPGVNLSARATATVDEVSFDAVVTQVAGGDGPHLDVSVQRPGSRTSSSLPLLDLKTTALVRFDGVESGPPRTTQCLAGIVDADLGPVSVFEVDGDEVAVLAQERTAIPGSDTVVIVVVVAVDGSPPPVELRAVGPDGELRYRV